MQGFSLSVVFTSLIFLLYLYENSNSESLLDFSIQFVEFSWFKVMAMWIDVNFFIY